MTAVITQTHYTSTYIAKVVTTTLQDLTTRFTPASSCFDPTWTLSPAGNDSLHGVVITRGYQPSCLPVGLESATLWVSPSATSPSSSESTMTERASMTSTTTVTAQAPFWYTSQRQVFSPGDCPVGYTTALQSLSSDANSDLVTFATCCPTGYVAVTDTIDPGCSMTNIATGTLIGGSRTIAWQAGVKQVAIIVANSGTSTAPLGGSSTLVSSTSEASTGASSANPESTSGLSAGTKAGIAVGAALGFLFIVGIGVVMLKRRRAKQQVRREEKEATAGEKAELAGEGKVIPELGPADAGLHEADGRGKPFEMGDSNTRVELAEIPRLYEMDGTEPRSQAGRTTTGRGAFA